MLCHGQAPVGGVPIRLAPPPDGHITACAISAEYTAAARRYWQKAQAADKIGLRLGPALETLMA